MKRIKYPPRGSAGFAKLVSDYKNLFASNLPKMETDWKGWKNRYHVTTISETVEDLLTADVDVIADVYESFWLYTCLRQCQTQKVLEKM